MRLLFPKNPAEISFLKKVCVVLAMLFLIQFVLTGVLMYQVAIKETSSQLISIAKRVREDISFQNGKWNTNRYNADPELPGTYPLYIFASDGYVIDRWKPLHGFLDTSDAKKLLSYTTPQNISTDTNQVWRVLSKPIAANGQKMGVLTVAFFNPQPEQFAAIDLQLQNNANVILSKITIANGMISTKNLDIRDISYDVVFQIVDQYNKIITKTDNTNSIDRIPNFIDTSYIGDALQNQEMRIVADNVSGEKFLIYSQPIFNNQKFVIGVIVVGKSIAFVGSILRDYIIVEGILGIIFTAIATWFIFGASRVFAKKYQATVQKKQEIQKIVFDKKSAMLSLNHHNISIPYATNQYYLMEALFANPKKRFETDELLEKFGEIDNTNTRKVYDAMNMINKKTFPILGGKLILVKNKTYQLNPLYTPFIK